MCPRLKEPPKERGMMHRRAYVRLGRDKLSLGIIDKPIPSISGIEASSHRHPYAVEHFKNGHSACDTNLVAR